MKFHLLLPVIVLAGCNVDKKPPAEIRAKPIPFMRVVADPAGYDGKKIISMGYLAIDEGTLKIYPSEQSFMADEDSAAIELSSSYQEQLVISKKYTRRYIFFEGVFEMTPATDPNVALGGISAFKPIFSAVSRARLDDEAANAIFVPGDRPLNAEKK